MTKHRPFLLDVGGVLASWIVLLAIENLVVGLGYRDEFSGAWEMAHARTFLSPIALGGSLPLAIVVVVVAGLAAARNVRAVAAIAAAGGAVTALGVSTGRHMASWAVRAPFVVVVAALAAFAAAQAVKRAPMERPRVIAAGGVLVACAAWSADAFVLPRLYPAFHLALLVLTLTSWSAIWLLVPGRRARGIVSTVALAVTMISLAASQRAANGVKGDDNLRRVLVEHAPLLGRAVVLATRIAPPPPLDEAGETEATAAAVKAGSASHALDWRGHDIVLVTIDALRADHVSSYGYGRKTTPNIDALAERGARFTHAYCPTPHTSYSVTSLMTGKYMRPLLAMGAGGEGSETWASYMRRYEFRTAAFYPPAVFFIDEHRFTKFAEDGLGFEYRKVEFAKPALRREQITAYLATAPRDKPLFLWVHLFEPHEPYEMHPEHPFSGDERVDAYDSEIATADGLVGDVVSLVEKRRPGAVFLVSADHGEELGDHGGRYHGTTVYEEQVRVPLVVVGPGVTPRTVVTTPVQTIDLLPTTLSALDIPLPARVRGRDLGVVLSGKPAPDPGLAFAETDDWTMVARGADRLVCARKIAACSLFDVDKDPGQKHAVTDREGRVRELRQLTAAIERENGRLEATALPDALRRGLQGDRDAAEDVAPLLDDARVDLRRLAARCAFKLRAPEMKPALSRALAKDEDAEVGTWSALALYRLGEEGDLASRVDGARKGGDPAARVAAALAFAERGDGRGEGELVSRWDAGFTPSSKEPPGELDEGREILAALAKLRAKSAAPSLVRSLEDVRLRPYVVDALGEIGDARAKDPLLAVFTSERYVNVRPKQARALLRLGAREELRAPLARFAGVPDAMPEAIGVMRDAALLAPARGGMAWDTPAPSVDVTLRLAGTGPARLYAIAAAAGPGFSARVDAKSLSPEAHGETWLAEIPEGPGEAARVEVSHPSGIRAVWLVRRAPEIPPPPPREWDAGAP